MEIVVPPTWHVLGLREFSSCMPRTAPDGQRSEPGHLDLVSHSLRKYCGLALKGNPSVPYFSTNSDLFDTKYAGHMVRLGFQEIELLETGYTTLPMPEDHRSVVIEVRATVPRILRCEGRS